MKTIIDLIELIYNTDTKVFYNDSELIDKIQEYYSNTEKQYKDLAKELIKNYLGYTDYEFKQYVE